MYPVGFRVQYPIVPLVKPQCSRSAELERSSIKQKLKHEEITWVYRSKYCLIKLRIEESIPYIDPRVVQCKAWLCIPNTSILGTSGNHHAYVCDYNSVCL